MADDQTDLTGDAPAPVIKPPRDYEMDGETPPAQTPPAPDPALTPDPEPQDDDADGDEPEDDDGDNETNADNRNDQPNGRQRGGSYKAKIARRDAEIERLAAENARLAAAQSKPPAQTTPSTPPPDEPKEPVLADFKTWDEFNEAKVQWIADKRVAEALKKADQERRVQAMQDEIAKKVQTFQAQEIEVAKKYPDYQKVVRKQGTHPFMAQLILESPHSAELAYRIKKDPAFETLNKGTVVDMAKHIGRLEAIIDNETKSTGTNDNAARKIPNAPPPMKPVGSGTGSASRFDAESSDDYEAYQADQRKRKQNR